MSRALRNILVAGLAAIGATGVFGLYVLFGYDRGFHAEAKTGKPVATLLFDFDATGRVTVSVDGNRVRLSPEPTYEELENLWGLKGVASGDVFVRLPANLPVGALKVNPGWFFPVGTEPGSLSLTLYSGNKTTVVRRDFPRDVFIPTCGGDFRDIRSPGIPWDSDESADFDRALANAEWTAGEAAYLFVELLPEDTTSTIAVILRHTDIPGIRRIRFVVLEPGELVEREIRAMPGMPPPRPEANPTWCLPKPVLPDFSMPVARAKTSPR